MASDLRINNVGDIAMFMAFPNVAFRMFIAHLLYLNPALTKAELTKTYLEMCDHVTADHAEHFIADIEKSLAEGEEDARYALKPRNISPSEA